VAQNSSRPAGYAIPELAPAARMHQCKLLIIKNARQLEIQDLHSSAAEHTAAAGTPLLPHLVSDAVQPQQQLPGALTVYSGFRRLGCLGCAADYS
jgi:hypothetical protein